MLGFLKSIALYIPLSVLLNNVCLSFLSFFLTNFFLRQCVFFSSVFHVGGAAASGVETYFCIVSGSESMQSAREIWREIYKKKTKKQISTVVIVVGGGGLDWLSLSSKKNFFSASVSSQRSLEARGHFAV